MGPREWNATSGADEVVQSPADASFPSMPRSAITAVAVDHVIPLREVGPLLARLVTDGWPTDDEESFADRRRRSRRQGRELPANRLPGTARDGGLGGSKSVGSRDDGA